MQQQARTPTSNQAGRRVRFQIYCSYDLNNKPIQCDSVRLGGMSIKEAGRMFSLPEQVMVQNSADKGKSK